MLYPVIFGGIAFTGMICVVLQVYHMVVIDAESRGLQHPKWWGVFAVGGNNSSGLIMYMIGRRKYPIVHISESQHRELQKRKKAVGVGLIFLVVGVVGFICTALI